MGLEKLVESEGFAHFWGNYEAMRIAYFFSVWFLFMASCQMGGLGPQAVESPYYNLNQYLDSLINEESFSGSLIIGDLEGIQFEKHGGQANRVWNIPIDRDTRFDIASVNKSFVGGLIILAEEQGKLKTTDRLVDWLANFDYSGKFDDSITLHHLLTHTSGLPDYDAVPKAWQADGFQVFKRQHYPTEAYVDLISQLEPIGPAGRQFYYSNFAYHLASIVLEQAYRKSFNEILQSQICQPLGLENTFNSIDNQHISTKVAEGYQFTNLPTKKGGVAEGYQATSTKGKYTRNNFIDLSLGRRIFSTAKDLYKWGRAMVDDQLFSAEAKTKMHQNYIGDLNPNLAYGYGWVVYQQGDQFAMGDLGIDAPYLIHGGKTEGFKAMLVVIDGGKLILSFLVNNGDQVNEMALALRLVHMLWE